jgi:hypothetical protein
MIRSAIISAAIVFGYAVAAQAGVDITRSDAPTVALAGFTTVTLTAASDNGAQIVGFDFASQPSYGFFGPMNQVNPVGSPTIFVDAFGFNCPFGVPCDPSQVSHFKFSSTSMTIPAGFASESSSKLRAVFASGTGLGTSVLFVQLVIPNAAAATVNYAGAIQTQFGSTNPVDNAVSGAIPVPIPEPASTSLVWLAFMSLVSVSRNRCRKRAGTHF